MHDDRTRLTHLAADGQVRARGEPFLVGNALLMEPGDPGGPPEEVANCRCVLVLTLEPGGGPLPVPPLIPLPSLLGPGAQAAELVRVPPQGLMLAASATPPIWSQ